MKRILTVLISLILTLTGFSLVPAAQDGSEELADVICEEQGYATKMPAGLSAEWRDNDGVRIWVGDRGYVPNVNIWRRSQKLSDPEKYVKETVPENYKADLGSRLVGLSLFESYKAGGRDLVAAEYIYKDSNGYPINLLHAVDVREDGDVEYYVRYTNSTREETLNAFDIAVRNYHADGSEDVEPRESQTEEQEPETAKDVDVPGVSEYSDDRFHVPLPDGWKIMTTGEYTAFSFKAWDPEEPGRSFFFFMKLEPFLKSQEAKDAYQSVVDGTMLDDILDPFYREMLKQIYAATGGGELYKFYADAPVMEKCDLDSFLYAVPDVRSYAEKYYSTGMFLDYRVFPDMSDISILEKKKNSLPAPSACPDNSVALISYTDDNGTACEGLVSAQPLNSIYIDFFGVDGNTYSVYLFSGLTAPEGELETFMPVLSSCLGSFGFEEDYVKKAVDISNADKEALLQQAEQSQALHDAMAEAWDEMIRN